VLSSCAPLHPPGHATDPRAPRHPGWEPLPYTYTSRLKWYWIGKKIQRTIFSKSESIFYSNITLQIILKQAMHMYIGLSNKLHSKQRVVININRSRHKWYIKYLYANIEKGYKVRSDKVRTFFWTTVKLVYNYHPWDPKFVAVVDRWSLLRGSLLL